MRLGEALQRRRPQDAAHRLGRRFTYTVVGHNHSVDQSKAQETNHAMPYLVLGTT
jgi:hypothetical protein